MVVMAAPAEPIDWIPEDDLLLKNAVEAGASLASLAKGAVPFSRRFDIHQLESRWRTLLYGLGPTEEVSARIAKISEIELELAASNPAKANRYNFKPKDSSSGKLKRESVRNHYYAMRKRIRSEPCGLDLGFLLPHTSHVGTGGGNGSGDLLKSLSDHQHDSFDLQFGHPESGYDGVDPFHPGHVGSSQNGLYGYTENISSLPVDEAGCNTENHPFEHDLPNIDGHTHISVNDNVGPHALPHFDPANHNSENLHTDYVGNDNISSQVPQTNGSFHQLGYASPSDMPVWEEMSSPIIGLDRHYEDKVHTGQCIDDNKETDAHGCGDANKLNDEMDDIGSSNPTTILENDLDCFLEFSDDDLLFMDEDKDIVDKPSLEFDDVPVLLNSPTELQQDVPTSGDFVATKAPETGLTIFEASCPGESSVIPNRTHSSLNNEHGVSSSCANMPSISSTIAHTDKDKPSDESLICVLNTEDLEVPCNDHVDFNVQSFSPVPSTSVQHGCRQRSSLISNPGVLSTDAKIGDLSNVKDEPMALALPSAPSEKETSQAAPGVPLPHSYNECPVKVDSSESGIILGAPNLAGISIDVPDSCTSPPPVSNSVAITQPKQESTVLDHQKHGSVNNIDDSQKTRFEGSDHVKAHSQNIADNCNEELKIKATSQANLPAHADMVPAEIGNSDALAIVPSLDQEDKFSDSEDDVPSFSDIEALILDMDLDPYDQEPFSFTKEVSRYQCTDRKKTIVRLEQGARSSMNRAIASVGAFAVFYGRHLKYFIKDTEVTLGRETEDVKVNIDLGREGRANKISRRQATIKMDQDGNFSLTNTGKFPIFVNNKEVPSKKRITLLSNSLVVIKDMSFIFQVNDSAVRRYINNLQNKSQGNNTTFDFKSKHS